MMKNHQTSSRSEILNQIGDAVLKRLSVPAPYLFKRLFMDEKRRLAKEQSHLERERMQLKDQVYAASMRVLLHEQGSMPLSRHLTGAPYLKRIQSRGVNDVTR